MAAWYQLRRPLPVPPRRRRPRTGSRSAPSRPACCRPTGEPTSPSLAVKVWGRTLPNPIGLAAGFDKNAEVPNALLDVGFGLVEIGSVTPRPQEGNPRPRLFRLPEDRGVINRMGFPGQGLDAVRSRLATRPRRGFIGVNVGANKDSTDRAADYVVGCKALAHYADYLVCNVSVAQHAGPAQPAGPRRSSPTC